MTSHSTKEYMIAWRLKNKEHIRQYSIKYCKDNKEKRKIWYDNWIMNNKHRKKISKRYWDINNSDKLRNSDLKKNYGITVDQYEKMFKDQNGLCAICFGTSVVKRRLCVDHNHITGKVRGLLCDRCNFGLGHFNESEKLLLKAIDYINSTK